MKKKWKGEKKKFETDNEALDEWFGIRRVELSVGRKKKVHLWS
jgi:hypothetical protein